MSIKPNLLRTLFFILGALFVQCNTDDSNDDTDDVPSGNGEFAVALSFPEAITSQSGQRNAQNLDKAIAHSIIITIVDSEGQITDYTSSKIELYHLGEEIVSQKISLPIGVYSITEFLVVDTENNIIYAAPLEGSLLAQNVEDPLPIEFSVLPDEVTPVIVEVLPTQNLDLSDFGLVGFEINPVELLTFTIQVSEKENSSNTLEATLEVSSGEYTYIQDLEAISATSVSIITAYDSYILTVNSEGYKEFSEEFERVELLNYTTVPLVIELEKLLWTAGEDLVDPRDGVVYETVQIGDQIWMGENLRATAYNDGTPIEFPHTNIELWESNTNGAYALYNYDETGYGVLYNWYAASSGKLCPNGWHIPSDDDWFILSTYLGGTSVAGGKMKSIGTDDWDEPNTGASNLSGFSAMPAGWAYFCCGHFSHKHGRAAFWSSDEGSDEEHGISRQIESDSQELKRYVFSNSSNKGSGFSCRCVKD